MKNYITKAVLIAAIVVGFLFAPGCASSGQGQGGSDMSNQRGGFFSSYTGNHGNTSSTTRIKGKTPDGDVDLEITSAAPFVVNFGEIEANTENAATGASNDTASNTTETKPATDLNLPGQ